jgi:hypothetical protein
LESLILQPNQVHLEGQAPIIMREQRRKNMEVMTSEGHAINPDSRAFQEAYQRLWWD